MPSKDPLKIKETRKKNYKKYKEFYIKKSRYQKYKNILYYFEKKNSFKCSKCSENHISCLEFHHTDPSKKEYNVSVLKNRSHKKLLKEIKKCIVLCSNCHKKLHWEDNKINKLKQKVNLYDQKKEKNKKEKEICKGCGKNKKEIDFVTRRYFCKECYKEYQKNKMRERRNKVKNSL